MKSYKTTNMYLAAAMLSLGASLDDIDHSDRKHQVFILGKRPDFDLIEKAYNEGRLSGNLCKYRDALQILKSKIHSF